MVGVSVDLASEQLTFLKKMMGTGRYRSRSEVVRDVLRRAEFEWGWRNALEEAVVKGVTPEIGRERKAVSSKLLKRFKNA